VITEILAQIHGTNFTVGIVLADDKVVETAPIVRYMRGRSRDQVRARCTKMGGRITVVRQIQREDVTAPPIKSGITSTRKASKRCEVMARPSSSTSMKTPVGARSAGG
jgi:hypothetical protein